jgi:hypothetical protein
MARPNARSSCRAWKLHTTTESGKTWRQDGRLPPVILAQLVTIMGKWRTMIHAQVTMGKWHTTESCNTWWQDGRMPPVIHLQGTMGKLQTAESCSTWRQDGRLPPVIHPQETMGKLHTRRRAATRNGRTAGCRR